MNENIISLLIELLGTERVLTGEALKDRYAHIWRMDQGLKAVGLVLPKSTIEVSEILKICHLHSLPVVVHGGLTNLVGSTETQANELVISMEKMNIIEELDEKSRTITVQAGVILEHIQIAAKEQQLLFPLNFGAKGSAQIGGVISTNAGGMRVFRFGMTRNLVLGLEAVLADGAIISSMKKIIKDNSAYDLKQLFIGSEGSLGIITRATLKLLEAPKSRTSAFVGINEYAKVVELLKFMDSNLAGTLSGYELILDRTYEGMTSPPALSKPPLPHGFKYYILLESLGSDQENDQARLQKLLEEAFEKELILDAVFAQSDADLNWFWKIREDVHVIVSQCNNDQHFDVSIPIPEIGSYIDKVVEELLAIEEVEQCYTFGHVADGNIHFVIGKMNNSQTLIQQINEVVYRPIKNLAGSVSAEHGIGLDKKAYLPLCRTVEEIQLMKTLKRALDPKVILNRGKVIDI